MMCSANHRQHVVCNDQEGKGWIRWDEMHAELNHALELAV